MIISRRKKIYIGSRDAREKAERTALIRKLVKEVFNKGLKCQVEGKPLPDSFIRLFGSEAIITSAVRYKDPDAFQFASIGGALHNREAVLLNLLSGKTSTKIISTDGIKESLLSSIHCVSVVDNPVVINSEDQDK